MACSERVQSIDQGVSFLYVSIYAVGILSVSREDPTNLNLLCKPNLDNKNVVMPSVYS